MPVIGHFISQTLEPTMKLMNIHVDSAWQLRWPSNSLGFPALSYIESGYRDIGILVYVPRAYRGAVGPAQRTVCMLHSTQSHVHSGIHSFQSSMAMAV